MNSNIINVANLELKIGEFKLDNISFDIPRGSVVALIGSNGSGKTLLIKCLLNVYYPDNGSIHIFGQDIHKSEINIKDRIACVFDDGFFFEQLSLKQMTEIISIGYSKWDPELFKNYINKFGLDLDQNIDKLSKGMKMKFALALAFSHEAELYIMDEPTNGLDMIFREEILEFIKTEVLNSNKTVIFSTHLSSDVENIADYLLILNNGKVIFENTKSAFLNLPRLKNETTFKGKLLDLLRKGGE